MSISNRLQSNYMDFLVKSELPLAIYLINGKRLEGVVIDADTYSILLNCQNATSLIMKGSIASIVPVRRLTGGEIEKIKKTKGGRR